MSSNFPHPSTSSHKQSSDMTSCPSAYRPPETPPLDPAAYPRDPMIEVPLSAILDSIKAYTEIEGFIRGKRWQDGLPDAVLARFLVRVEHCRKYFEWAVEECGTVRPADRIFQGPFDNVFGGYD